MFYENKVTSFLMVVKKLERLSGKTMTAREKRKFEKLQTKKEKLKEIMKEIGQEVSDKSIFDAMELAKILSIVMIITEGENFSYKEDSEKNIHIIGEEEQPVITMESSCIQNGTYQIYSFDGEKIENNNVKMLKSQIDFHERNYLYHFINQLIGMKLDEEKDKLTRDDIANCIQNFVFGYDYYVRHVSDYCVYKKKAK